MMYKYRRPEKTVISHNKSYVAESLIDKVRRIMNNREPIESISPLVFTERKDGVLAGTDPRTDRFEVAIEAMDIVGKSHKAKRENKSKTIGEQAKDGMELEKDGKPESTQGTDKGK